MLRLPLKAIETNRLLLQPYSLKWQSEIHSLIINNKHRLSNSFPNLLKSNENEEATKTYILRKKSEWTRGKTYSYILVLKATNCVLGHFTIKDIDWRHQECELSYFIDAPYEKKGLITEALSAVLQLCFMYLNMNRVTVRIVTENIASIKVAEKSGFKYEGTFFNDYLTYDNKQVDTFRYGISREDFFKKHN